MPLGNDPSQDQNAVGPTANPLSEIARVSRAFQQVQKDAQQRKAALDLAARSAEGVARVPSQSHWWERHDPNLKGAMYVPQFSGESPLNAATKVHNASQTAYQTNVRAQYEGLAPLMTPRTPPPGFGRSRSPLVDMGEDEEAIPSGAENLLLPSDEDTGFKRTGPFALSSSMPTVATEGSRAATSRAEIALRRAGAEVSPSPDGDVVDVIIPREAPDDMRQEILDALKRVREEVGPQGPRFRVKRGVAEAGEKEFGWLSGLKAGWESGQNMVELSDLSWKGMFQELSPKEEKRLRNLREGMDPNMKAEGWFEEGWLEAWRMMPMQARSLWGGLKGAAPGAAAGAGVALVAGQLGPQAAVPEELATVPGAAYLGGKTGFFAGSALSVAKLEAGLAYDEISNITNDQGETIDKDVARSASLLAGIVNGALEIGGLAVLIKNMPGGRILLSRFSREAIKETLQNRTIRESLKRLGKGISENITAETLVEIAQEASNIAAAEYSKAASPGEFEPTSLEEVGGRLGETALRTAQAMTYMGAVGPSGTFAFEQTRNLQSKFPTRKPRRIGGDGDPAPAGPGGVTTPDAALQVPIFSFPNIPAKMDGEAVHENDAIQSRLKKIQAVVPMLRDPRKADRIVQAVTNMAQDQVAWEQSIAAKGQRTGQVNKEAQSRADAMKRTLDSMLLLADKDLTAANSLLGRQIESLIFTGQTSNQSPAEVEAKAALAEWAYGVSEAAAERNIPIPDLPPLQPEQMDDIAAMSVRVAQGAQQVLQQDSQAPVGAPAPLRDYEPGDATAPRVRLIEPEQVSEEILAEAASDASTAADYRNNPTTAMVKDKAITNRLSHGTTFLAGHFVAENPRALTSVEQDAVPVVVQGGRKFVIRPDGPVEITDDLRRADLYSEIPTRGGVIKPGWHFVPARVSPVAFKLEDDRLLIDRDATQKRTWVQKSIGKYIMENSGEVDMSASPMEDPGSLGLMFLQDPPSDPVEVDNLIATVEGMKRELRRQPLPTLRHARKEVDATLEHDYEGGSVNREAEAQRIYRDKMQHRLAVEGLLDSLRYRMLARKEELVGQTQAVEQRQRAHSVEHSVDQPRVIATPDNVEQYLRQVKAFHGTPHRGIRKFDLQKIGTGEGGQAYGWGLYFAQEQDVAEAYREGLAGPSLNEVEVRFGDEDMGTLEASIDPTSGKVAYQWRFDPEGIDGWESAEIIRILESEGFRNRLHNLAQGKARVGSAFQQALDTEIAHARSLAEGTYERANKATRGEFKGPETAEQLKRRARTYQRRLEVLRRLQDKGIIVDGLTEDTGQTYEVRLPNIEKYLDWDKTLYEQPEVLRKIQENPALQIDALLEGMYREELTRAAISQVPAEERVSRIQLEDLTGARYYELLSRKFAEDPNVPTQEYNAHKKAASLALRDADIPGLKFLDAFSRRVIERGGYEEGLTSNYVVFDENEIRDVTENYPKRRAADNMQRIDDAEQANELDAGSAALMRHLLTLDPTFDYTDALEVVDKVVQATPEILVQEGLNPDDAAKYRVTGSTITEAADGAIQTAIRLYRGAHPGTVVEEWYHRSWNRMSLQDKERFRQYHEQSGDPRSIEEHFAQEGRDWFFSERLHEQTGWGILDLFARARNSLTALIRRIKDIRGMNIPDEIQRMYGQAYRGIPGLRGEFSQKLFDDWFRDSAVQTPEGEPITVYHGTQNDWTPGPDMPATDRRETWNRHGGFHISEDHKVANEFGRHGRVYPYYASIQNPLDLSDSGGEWSLSSHKNRLKLFETLRRQGHSEQDIRDAINRAARKRRKPQPSSARPPLDQLRDFTLPDILEELGYDGVRYSNRNSGEMMASLRELGFSQETLQERFAQDFLGSARWEGAVFTNIHGRYQIATHDGLVVESTNDAFAALQTAQNAQEALEIYGSFNRVEKQAIREAVYWTYIDQASEARYRQALPELPLNYIVFRPEQLKSAVGNAGVWNRRSRRTSFSVERNEDAGNAGMNPEEMQGQLDQLTSELINLESERRALVARKKNKNPQRVKEINERIKEIQTQGDKIVGHLQRHQQEAPSSFNELMEARRAAEFEAEKKKHLAEGLGFSGRKGRRIWESLDDFEKYDALMNRILSDNVNNLTHLDRLNPDKPAKYWGDWRPSKEKGSARNPDNPNQSQHEALQEAYQARRKKMQQDQKDISTIRKIAAERGQQNAPAAITRQIPVERLLQLSIHDIDRMLRDDPNAFEALTNSLLSQQGVEDANEFISHMPQPEYDKARMKLAELQQKMQQAFDNEARRHGIAIDKEVKTREEENRLTFSRIVTRTNQTIRALGQGTATILGRPSLVLGWRKQAPNAKALMKYIDSGDFDRSIFKILYEADLTRHKANREAFQGKFQPLIEAAVESRHLDALIFNWLDNNVALENIPETKTVTIRGRQVEMPMRQMISDLREFYEDIIDKAEEAKMNELVIQMGDMRARINAQINEIERREVEAAHALGYTSVQTRQDIDEIDGLRKKVEKGLEDAPGDPDAEPGSLAGLSYSNLKRQLASLERRYEKTEQERDAIAEGGMRIKTGYVTHIHRLSHQSLAHKLANGSSDTEIINLKPKDRDRFLQPREGSTPIPSWVEGFFLYTPAMNEYIYLDSVKNEIWPKLNQIKDDSIRLYVKNWIGSLKNEAGTVEDKMNRMYNSIIWQMGNKMLKQGKDPKEVVDAMTAHGARPLNDAIYNFAKFNYYSMLSPVRIGGLSLLEMAFMSREIAQSGRPTQAALLLADTFMRGPFRAAKQLWKEWRSFRKNRRDPLHAREFSEATEMGVTDTIHEMSAQHGMTELQRRVLQGERGIIGKTLQKLGSAWALSMRAAELALRTTTYETLKLHGLRNGMTEQQAKIYSASTTNDLIGAYNKRDTAPSLARNSISRPLIFLTRFTLNKTELMAADGILGVAGSRSKSRELPPLGVSEREPPTSSDPRWGQWSPAEKAAYQRGGEPLGRMGLDQDMLKGMAKYHLIGLAAMFPATMLIYKALEPILGPDYAARYANVAIGRLEAGLGAYTSLLSTVLEAAQGAHIYLVRHLTGSGDEKPTKMEKRGMKQFKNLLYFMPYAGATIRDIQKFMMEEEEDPLKALDEPIGGGEEDNPLAGSELMDEEE